MFVHRYPYNDSAADARISEDGGLVNGMLYSLWPFLETRQTCRSGILWHYQMTTLRILAGPSWRNIIENGREIELVLQDGGRSSR